MASGCCPQQRHSISLNHRWRSPERCSGFRRDGTIWHWSSEETSRSWSNDDMQVASLRSSSHTDAKWTHTRKEQTRRKERGTHNNKSPDCHSWASYSEWLIWLFLSVGDNYILSAHYPHVGVTLGGAASRRDRNMVVTRQNCSVDNKTKRRRTILFSKIHFVHTLFSICMNNSMSCSEQSVFLKKKKKKKCYSSSVIFPTDFTVRGKTLHMPRK